MVKAVETLPAGVAAEHGARVEADLVDYASGFDDGFDPHQLAILAHRIHACLDPDGQLHDGQLHDAAHRQRRREVTVRQRPDGSAALGGELTAECAERLLGVFDALGAPKPETNGVKDPRSAGQRRHDALLDALTRLARSDTLPTSAGVATTVIVTVDADTWRTGHGCASTSHGALVPAETALGWGGADQRLVLDAVDTTDTAGTGRHRHRRRGRGPVSHQTAVHPAATPRADRQRPRLHLPRLRHPARLDRDPPHHRLATRRHHDPRQRRHGLPLPPRALRPARLAMRVPRRPTRLDPATTPRPRPETQTQPTPRERHSGESDPWTWARM